MAGENIYALCDVDDERAAASYERFPHAKRYADFRAMLERERDHIDAVTVSGSGERQPDPGSSAPEEVSSETLSMAGNTALNLVLTLDQPTASIPTDPASYLKVGDNLLPGWTLRLLALALVLPSLVAGADAWLRDRRRNARTTRRSIPWVLERALLPLAALLLIYLIGLIGLVDRPGFPYDPGLFSAGAAGPVALAAIALGVMTYDANLLVLTPTAPSSEVKK